MTKPTSVRWRITMVLIFASFTDYFLRSNLSLAAATIIPDLGLSEIQWGWVMATFPLGYAIFQLPGGVAADRFGPRRVLTLSMLAWGLLIVLTALVPGPAVVPLWLTIVLLIAVEFAVGATHAPIYPTVACTVQRWFPAGKWALPNGLTSTGLTWGMAAATPISVVLVAMVGWRMTFMLMAPLSFLGAALWWWYARDYPTEHSAVNGAEAELIDANRPNDHGRDELGGGWRQVVSNRDLLLLTLSYSFMNYGFYTAFGWLPYYLLSISEGGQDVGVITTSLQWIAGGIGAALGGWLCDRLCRRIGFGWGCRLPIIISMLANGIFIILALMTDNYVLAGGFIVAFFFFGQSTEGPYWCAAMAIGRRLAGSAGGVLNTGANAMGVVSLLAAPVIADQLGWKVAIGTCALFSFLAAALMFFVRADRPIKDL